MEQIPEFPDPGGGLQDFQPVQSSAAVSPGHAWQGVFRTFPRDKKSPKVGRQVDEVMPRDVSSSTLAACEVHHVVRDDLWVQIMTDDDPYYWQQFADGSVAHAARHSPGLREVSGTASSSMSNLAKFCRRCRARFGLYIGGIVVDVVLPVLMQRQTTAVLVSLQWRCHRFSSSTSWGFSLGSSMCIDKLLMYQWSGKGRFPLLSVCL